MLSFGALNTSDTPSTRGTSSATRCAATYTPMAQTMAVNIMIAMNAPARGRLRNGVVSIASTTDQGNGGSCDDPVTCLASLDDEPAQPANSPKPLCSTPCYSEPMTQTITQRELRNDSGDIMRRLDQGETFIVTRNGTPVG